MCIAGFYSLAGETVEAAIYLIEKLEKKVSYLGSYTGTIDTLEYFPGPLRGALLERFAKPALQVFDVIGPPNKTYKVAPEDRGAFQVEDRIFIYKNGNYRIQYSESDTSERSILFGAPSDKRNTFVYNTIQIKPDSGLDDKGSAVPKPSANEKGAREQGAILAEAARQVAWESSKHELASSAFSRSLSRLVVSVPVTALALGGFFVGYEAFTRSALDVGGLALRAAPAILSLGLSIGFAIDTGIRIAGLARASF
ncbi:MAG TPA: hypothetical protein VIO60_03130 [Rectinemataceae bacterium]